MTEHLCLCRLLVFLKGRTVSHKTHTTSRPRAVGHCRTERSAPPLSAPPPPPSTFPPDVEGPPDVYEHAQERGTHDARKRAATRSPRRDS